VASWNEFKAVEPTMAEEGRQLLYDVGVGLAFLGTVRMDGGPRLHPMCPVVCDDGLFAFIVPSPKRADLHRDGRYAMHSFPLADNEDAFYLTGTARHVTDRDLRSRLGRQFAEERSALALDPPGDDQHLFEFDVSTAMLTRTTGHGDPNPRHQVWHAPAPGRSPASG
jgi:hypothetical protein